MKNLSIYLLALVFIGCSEKEDEGLFTVVDPSVSHLDFTNSLTETSALNILDYLYFYNGGGVGIADINNDSLPDIYFSGNQVKNKLFLNKGNLQFEDITAEAGVEGNSDWNTGVSMADVNGDGYIDIYVCAVVGINGLRGKNELFINNGDNSFTEEAEKYGLDFENYSSNAAFFDYDNDGDLDMYLLNHAVHTVDTYGPSDIRNNRSEESGDKLLRNDGGKFVDVSAEAGIYGGVNGYGLGVATADFNNDGYTDIYVSNDFHEDDLYYINNGDGSFNEVLKEKFGHVSRFSMGSDVADVNQDGFMDILTLDMLPEDERVLKASVGDDPVDLNNLKIDKLGYHHQYTRNMLQLNQGGKYFQEVGLLSGLAATDWSWSALFADYDLDGQQDVFITTGIPKRPNDLDYIKYLSNEQIQKKINTTRLIDKKALAMMPSGAVENKVLRGSAGLDFKDMTGNWIKKDSIISTGAAFADLDNDGDLDVVTNNIDHPASLYRNDQAPSNYLKVKLEYPSPNPFGIGTTVISYHDGKMQTKQMFTSRGFQSSSEPVLHFGYGETTNVDSLLILWPDGTFQKEIDIKTKRLISLAPNQKRDSVNYSELFHNIQPWFEQVDSLPGLDYVHEENPYSDFNRQKLIPYKISDRGPGLAVKDIDGDGKEDIFFGNSKFTPARLYLQDQGGFKLQSHPAISEDSASEDVSTVIEDFDLDGRNDLYVLSSGGEYYGANPALKDRLYLSSSEGKFSRAELPEQFVNGSIVTASDYNKDGKTDLFVGGGAVSNDFGNIPDSYLLKNDGGKFSVVSHEGLQKIGMVTDAIWTDFNNDGWEDLIVVGEWMGPQFFRNNKGSLTNITGELLKQTHTGLWQSVFPFDINNDGQMDYLLGNWGKNSKFRASEEYPLVMFYKDFDGNGSTETIVAYEKNGKYYPVNGLDELVSQLAFLRKKFNAYHKFAGKSLEEIIDPEQLRAAVKLEVTTLASGYLLNSGGNFSFKPFEAPLQVAPITAFLKSDFNKDGTEEVLVAGNYFGVTPYHGRFDGLAGNIITGEGKILEGAQLGLNFTQQAVRHLNTIELDGTNYLMVTPNNGKPQFYKILE